LNPTNHHRALLALRQVPELGLRRIRQLLNLTGNSDASALFDLTIPDFLKIDGFADTLARNIVEFDEWDEVDQILEETAAAGAELVAYGDKDFPPLLNHIYDPPLILWLLGEREALRTDGIGVVGTRRPGRYGREQASEWTQRLTASGLTINSGLAYGVDSIAHRATVDEGGRTIAVLGSGIDVIYPAKNIGLARQITDCGGAVITEYPPGTKPDAVNFPGRNRIVSGMSHGVLVVESGIKGGSMITARSALDQNREVFVIPHPLGQLGGEGCNYLIKSGQGKLVQSLADILDEISVSASASTGTDEMPQNRPWESLDLDESSREICTLLSEDELHIDLLAEKTGKPAHSLLPLLLDLEMKGAIRQKAGKYFELC
jgi:DNA processing protein